MKKKKLAAVVFIFIYVCLSVNIMQSASLYVGQVALAVNSETIYAADQLQSEHFIIQEYF